MATHGALVLSIVFSFVTNLCLVTHAMRLHVPSHCKIKAGGGNRCPSASCSDHEGVVTILTLEESMPITLLAVQGTQGIDCIVQEGRSKQSRVCIYSRVL